MLETNLSFTLACQTRSLAIHMLAASHAFIITPQFPCFVAFASETNEGAERWRLEE